MNPKLVCLAMGLAFAAALAACTEQPQTVGQNSRRDAPAFEGPATAFTAAGWKPGDRNSWDQELKTRTNNGQNEYTRVN